GRSTAIAARLRAHPSAAQRGARIMIRLALVGASGRMGRRIIDVLPEFPKYQLTAAVVSSSSRSLGMVAPNSNGVRFSSDISAAARISDVVIDFSYPAASVLAARACAALATPCLIATTGHSEEEREDLIAASQNTPMAIVPNTSMGVYVTRQMAQLAAR